MVILARAVTVTTSSGAALFAAAVPAGFPSPADDYLEKKLDLNEHLVKHPSATFFVRVQGHSMTNAGIFPGDILIVDRSLEPADGRIVLVVLNGDYTVKRLRRRGASILLCAENPAYEPIEVKEGMDFEIWGVVAHVIHSV